MKKIIQADLIHRLKLVFGIEIKKEVRMVDCLVLTRIKKDDALLKTKGIEYAYELNNQGEKKYLSNSVFSNLLWHLNEETPNIPWVMDETNIPDTMKIDLALKIKSFEDIKALKHALEPYGLDLIYAKREMEMIVITEGDLEQH